MSVFTRLWFGQWLSNLGTQVSLFGLGLWLFKTDGQLGSFALVAIVVQLSRLAVMRVLVRRLECWPRRRVMLVANAMGAAATLGLAALLGSRGAEIAVVSVIPFLAVAAAAESALVLSFSTLIPQLVPIRRRGEANGLFASADGLAALVAPFLGALLVAWTGLAGIVVVDAGTFLVALGCVVLGRWPRRALRPLAQPTPARLGNGSTLRDALSQIQANPRLLSLLQLGAALMTSFAGAELIFPAWVLQLPAGRTQLGIAMGMSGVAYGLGLLLWRRFASQPLFWPHVFLIGLAVQGLVLLGAAIPGIAQHLELWLLGVAAFNLAVPLVLAAQQCLWQQWVATELQPRFFAARYATDWTARLVAVLLVGPVVDRLLAPLKDPATPGRPMAVALALLGAVMGAMLLLRWNGFSVRDEKLPPCAS